MRGHVWTTRRLRAETRGKHAPVHLADAAARQFVDDVHLPRRGRGVQSCPTWVRNSASVGAAQPGASTSAATTRWPSRSSGTPKTAQSATPGCDANAASTNCGNTVSPPVLIASSARPSTRQHPRTHPRRQRHRSRNQPGSANGSGFGRIAVTLGDGRAAECNPTVESMRTRTPSSGTPSYTQPPAVSLIPYVRTTEIACRRSLFGNARRHRPAADQDRVQFGQRGGGRRVGQRLVQLRGHQRGIAPAGTHRRNRAGSSATSKPWRHGDRRATRDHAAHQHLQAGDVVGGQRRAATAPARRGGGAWHPRWRSVRRP